MSNVRVQSPFVRVQIDKTKSVRSISFVRVQSPFVIRDYINTVESDIGQYDKFQKEYWLLPIPQESKYWPITDILAIRLATKAIRLYYLPLTSTTQ